ncbi:hypothetical protein GCM10011613_21000 [Cellvibrio zantedeschiae]|uniref:Uncharacterized protein n=1 Tax=Cellvibrio zantedeschiae TaxID=1237077 RepID=A0ABQ3B340_9GAMM|nr:hypothetical protein [Cellvibrio zantedeschiae]GGY75290.1 hypothetical protein GCM10011613_21000 [Cellvibrio zantedeschiae]
MLDEELLFELELIELDDGLLETELLETELETLDKLVWIPVLAMLDDELLNEVLDELLDELMELLVVLEDDVLLATDVVPELEADDGAVSFSVSPEMDETVLVTGVLSTLKLFALPPPAPPPHALNNIKHKRLTEVSFSLRGDLKLRRPNNINVCIR